MAIKKILVGTDYTEWSRQAVAQAAELSQAYGAELHLVYAWAAPYGLHDLDEVGPAGESLPLRARILEHAEQEMARFVGTIPELQGITYQTHVLSGPPAATLTRQAEAHAVDLVVVGTHRRRGFTRALLGSVAEQVVQSSHVPVLVIPAHADSEDA